ncbi:hypothetical protein M5D96_011526 [Drosophila gunungcola]|uniref:Uncharacterized protein n=1 Tax=Drosophila gunungcola TaxID=103775 RepID=A0A9P9YFI7_9MUSC|nr:hypothetical protein M5D96_011526 [Drosophila gunungcola]
MPLDNVFEYKISCIATSDLGVLFLFSHAIHTAAQRLSNKIAQEMDILRHRWDYLMFIFSRDREFRIILLHTTISPAVCRRH